MKMKNSGLIASGQTHFKSVQNVISSNHPPTMSSLEMVDYINADRKAKAELEGTDFPCKKYRKLRHADFTKKVPKVLGAGYAKNFSDPIKNEQNGEEYPGYRFPKREACLMAMSYSYDLQAAVYDYMDELDRQNKGYLNHSVQQLQDIVATAWSASNADSSDAGRRLRKRQDDLILLQKAEYLVERLSQLPLGLIGGGKQGREC